MKGAFVPLSVNYRESDKMLAVEPLAELLFVRSLAFAKEKFSDGFVSSRQARLLTKDLDGYGRDDDELIAQLVRAGLWHPVEEGWVIEGWTDWNSIDASRAGTYGNHLRWHVRRGLTEETCHHCDRPESGAIEPDIGGESPLPEPEPPADDDMIVDAEVVSEPQQEVLVNRGESGATEPDDRVRSLTQHNRVETEQKTHTRTEQFNAFWSAYPKKVSKGHAEGAFKAKVPSVVAFNVLMDGLARSVHHWRVTALEPRLIPNPATWLNGKRWDDDYEIPTTSTGSSRGDKNRGSLLSVVTDRYGTSR